MPFGRRPFVIRVAAPALVLVAVFLIAGLPPPAFASAGSTIPNGLTPELTDALSAYSGSFASRAGFDPSTFASVLAPHPAAGSELVVVTFRPTSPSFFAPPSPGAPPMTLAEIANDYGLSSASYSAAESYFESQGLTVVHTSPDRLSLTVSGAPSELGAAFETKLLSGTYDGRAVTYPSVAPALPPSLEPVVGAVTGLATGFDTFAVPSGLPLNGSSPAARPAQGPDLITPALAREIYQISSLYNVTGTPQYAVGQGIVLLLWGWGYAPSDLQTFFSNDYPANFPQPAIQAFPVDMAPAPAASAVFDPSKAPEELTLDIEWAGSMAPGATLDAVYAPDGPASQGYSPTDASMADALNEAVTGISGVSVVSMSFGTPENESSGLQSAWATDFATAAHEGITLLAATGDLGGDAEANCHGGPSMSYPASDPDVLAVGGTDPALARNILGQVTGLASESAWSMSGGGFSGVYRAPSWETVGSAAGPIEANGGFRGTPDVSAAATYNFLHYNGTDGVAAGTSFATPLWAGLVSEMNAQYGQRLGFLTPRLYAVGAKQESGGAPTGLADITSGTTCIGTAGPGWDTETGWGSPRAALLFEDLTATFANLTIAASPATVPPGGSISVTARLTNRTSGAPIAGVDVLVNVASSNLEGPCTGAWGSASLPSNASGFVTFSVTVPGCFLGAQAIASVTVASDGYYATNSSNVAVNLLGFFPALEGIEAFPVSVIAFGLIMLVGAVIGYALGRSPSPPPSPPPPARPAASTPPPPPSPPPSPPPAAPGPPA